MKISKIDIGFVETDDVSINVYLSGCNLNCKGCFSPELKDFKAGYEISVDELIETIKGKFDLTKTVCLLGGNPPDNNDLIDIVKKIKDVGGNIWLYSGYGFEDIKNKEWVQYCDYIKAGPYIESMESKDYRWASTNQKLYHKDKGGKWEIVEEYNA